MANIDNLNFNVILDNKKFEEQINRSMKMAEDFSKKMKKVLDLQSSLKGASGGEAKGAERRARAEKQAAEYTYKALKAKKESVGLTSQEATVYNKLLTAQKREVELKSKSLKLAKQQLKESSGQTKDLQKQRGVMQELETLSAKYLSVFGGIQLVRSLVRITGEFEAQRVALRAILQDVAGADTIFFQLQDLAVKSPYTFKNLVSYAKQLSAFSVPQEEIFDVTKQLADVSAGLGVDMSRIILAYGQVRSAAYLRGQELRQFTEAGIPLLQILADQFSEIEGRAIGTGDVFDRISKRQVPFAMVAEAFNRMTAEGGKFHNMQEVLAETVKGKITNLSDAWEIMLSRVGDKNSGLIKGAVGGLTELIQNYERMGKILVGLIAGYGAYRTAVALTTIIMKTQAAVLAETEVAISGFNALLKATGTGFSNLWKIIKGANWGAIGIGAAAAGLAFLYKHLREVGKAVREARDAAGEAVGKAEASKSKLHYYVSRLKETTEGTKEYTDARSELIKQAGDFISAEDRVALSLSNVNEVWENICKNIDQATKLQAIQSATAQAEANRTEAHSQTMKKFFRKNKDWKDEEGKQNVIDYITGRIELEELRKRMPYLMDTGYGYRKEWEKAEALYKEELDAAKQVLSALYGSFEQPKASESTPLTGWRARVEAYLKTVEGGHRGMDVDISTALYQYVEKGAEALNDARKALDKVPFGDADAKLIEEDIKFYMALSEAIYGKGNTEFNNITARATKDAKKNALDQAAVIRQNVQNLKLAKDYFDQLTSLGMSGKNAAALLSNFGIIVPEAGFEEAFEEQARAMEKLGGKYKLDAQDIRNTAAGKDLKNIVSDLKQSNAELEKFDKAFAKLSAKSKELGYTGIAFDIKKDIEDMAAKNAEVDVERDTMIKQLYDGEAAYKTKLNKDNAEEENRLWKEYVALRLADINKFYNQQKENNKKLAQEAITGRARAFFNELTEGLDTSNLADKSFGQLSTLLRTLDGLFDRDALINAVPKELRNELDASNISLEDFTDKVVELGEKMRSNVEVEKWKELSEVISGLARKIKDVADAFGDTSWGGVFGGIAEGAGTLASGFKSMQTVFGDNFLKEGIAKGSMANGGWVGVAAIGLTSVLTIVGNIASSIKRVRDEQEAWALVVADTEHKYRLMQIEKLRYDKGAKLFDTASAHDRAKAAADEAKAAREELERVAGTLAKGKVKTDIKEVVDWGGVAGNAAAGAVAGAAIGSVIPAIGTLIGAGIGFLLGGVGSLFGSKKTKEITATLGKQYGQIYDPVTLELNEKIIAHYEEMDDATKRIIDNWDAIKEKMEEAREALNEAVDSFVGDIETQIRDALVNAFSDGDIYNALDDINGYIGQMLRRLMANMAFSRMLGPVLDELSRRLYQSYGFNEYGVAMTEEEARAAGAKVDFSWVDDIDDFYKGLPSVIGVIEAMLKASDTYLRSLGYDGFTGTSDDVSLGYGIKNITEDTANLLASYINAIRVDVAYGTTLWERIADGVEAQAGQLPPTLAEYLTHIEAYAANIEYSNMEILKRMDNVMRTITTESGQPAFRTIIS